MKCKNCETNDATRFSKYTTGDFCCLKCSRAFSTKMKRNEINQKVSEKLKGHQNNSSFETKAKISKNNCRYWLNKKRDIASSLKLSNIRQEYNEKNQQLSEKGLINPDTICKSCGQNNCVLYGKFICTNCKLQNYPKYKELARFKFNVFEYPKEFDLHLIETYGWYSAKNRGGNLNGVSRDHVFSVLDGFKNKIDPEIISHPANCRLILQKINSSKKAKSLTSLEDLLLKIAEWNEKYKQ